MESSLDEPRGTRAWIVVPQFGCDSIVMVPFTSFSRSSMLMRPSPRLVLAASRSKPAPESLTVRWISSDVPHNRTSKCRTPLCFAELCRASWRTRKKQREMSGDKGPGNSWVWKSTSTFCCAPRKSPGERAAPSWRRALDSFIAPEETPCCLVRKCGSSRLTY